MFKLFAELIRLSSGCAQDALVNSEAAPLDERADAELREQFIAVLGHDLRNPLAAIDPGTKLIGEKPIHEQGPGIPSLIERSVRRMAGLIATCWTLLGRV